MNFAWIRNVADSDLPGLFQSIDADNLVRKQVLYDIVLEIFSRTGHVHFVSGEIRSSFDVLESENAKILKSKDMKQSHLVADLKLKSKSS